MMNPLKKPFENVLQFFLEGYVEVKSTVVNWIRKVRYPVTPPSKTVKPTAPPTSTAVFTDSFRGKLEAHLNNPDRISPKARPFSDFTDEKKNKNPE